MERRLKELANDIRLRLKRGADDIYCIGAGLCEAKALLPGRFLAWLSDEFDITERTARNYMAVYTRFNDAPEKISGLKPAILYALTTQPDVIVDEVLARCKSGEKLTGAQVDTLIIAHQQKAVESAVKAGERAGRKVAEEVLATGGYVSVGGESVALDAAITEEMAETKARQTQHIVDSYVRKAGVSNDVRYQGSATVISVDPQGCITLLAPDLAMALEEGKQVTYVVFVKVGTE